MGHRDSKTFVEGWEAQEFAGYDGHVNKGKGRVNRLVALACMKSEGAFHHGRNPRRSEARVQRSGYEA